MYIKKIIRELNIDKMGFFELMIAIFPILLPFTVVSLGLLVLLIVITFTKPKANKVYKPLIVLAMYVLLHDIVLFFTMTDVPDTYVNLLLQNVIFFGAIIMISPHVKIEKMIGAINFVAVICIMGMLYQTIQIAMGQTVQPLIYMFQPSSYFMSKELVRPMSFFLEPSAYVLYMILPLFFAMIRRQYVYLMIIVLSFFASTSTTGLAISFIIPLVYIIKNPSGLKSRIKVLTLMGALFVALISMSIFSASVNKANETEMDSNVRLAQGPMFVLSMPATDYLFGCNYATTYDYYLSGELGTISVTVYGDNLYLSATWFLIAKYGILGLLLYVFCYLGLARRENVLWPYVICSLLLLFTSEKTFNGVFVFEMIVIQAFIYKNSFKKHITNENRPYRIRVR